MAKPLRFLAVLALPLLAAAALALDDKLVTLARSKDASDRIDAALGLAKDGSDEAFKLFVRLLDDDDVMVRDNAIVACDHVTKPELVAKLLPRASSGKTFERWNMAEALGRTKCAAALPALRKLALEDRDAEVRRAALWALDGFTENLDAHAIAVEAMKSTDPTVRATAVWAVGRVRAKGAAAVVEAALADPDDRVRAVAVYRYRWLDKVAFESRLLGLSADSSPRVRAACAEAAWSLQTAPCIDVLIALLGDPDLRTAALAHRCLRQAARKSLDRDTQVWKSWWGGARDTWKPKSNADMNWFWDDKYATKAEVYGAQLNSRRLVIVLDISAPQALKKRAEEETRWDEIRGKVMTAIGNLESDVEVNVVLADDDVRTVFKEPRALDATSRQRIATMLADVRPHGGCDLWGAMRAALDQPGVDSVLLVSYAERDAGDLRHKDRVREAIERRAESSRAVIHTVFLTSKRAESGDSLDSGLMWSISNSTLGRARMRTFE
ncbi:MAG: HEAT repeat domain-containing protein [Planctomycetes bacterium]|nr:HEAT repeat domain-containing protein [Planctomycetota bacterium]